MRAPRFRNVPNSGFALVVTITLVAALAVILLGLATIGRVEIKAQANLEEATQARRNALFALDIAVGQLQRYAAQNDIITVRADYLGPLAANGNWTGVFSQTGQPIVWLVNGSEQGAGTINPSFVAPAPTGRNSTSVQLLKRALDPTEYVTLLKSEIKAYTPSAAAIKTVGRYAYWVSDESLKVSMAVRTDLAPPGGLAAYPAPHIETIFTALNLNATNADREKLVVTDQVLSVAGVTGAGLNSNWQHVTACSRGVNGVGNFVVGAFNVNSSSGVAWRAVLGAIDPAPVYTTTLAAIATASRPFTSVDDFEAKLGAELGVGGATEAARIRAGLTPLLTTRGDTFLVRAYGETVDPLASDTDLNRVRATAMCEAMVQRTLTAAAEPKFVVTYLRWLGPADI